MFFGSSLTVGTRNAIQDPVIYVFGRKEKQQSSRWTALSREAGELASERLPLVQDVAEGVAVIGSPAAPERHIGVSFGVTGIAMGQAIRALFVRKRKPPAADAANRTQMRLSEEDLARMCVSPQPPLGGGLQLAEDPMRLRSAAD